MNISKNIITILEKRLYPYIFLTFIGFLIFLLPQPIQAMDQFQDVCIRPAYRQILFSHPELMKNSGARIIVDQEGTQYLIAIGSVVRKNKDQSLSNIIRMAEIKAKKAVLECIKGIKISTFRGVKETINLSSFFQVTECKVEGKIHELPIIGSWWSRDKSVYHRAIGIIKNFGKIQLNKCIIHDKDFFLTLLKNSPVMLWYGGLRGYILEDKKVIIAVGLSEIKSDISSARRVAKLKAIRYLLGYQEKLHILSIERLKDQEEIKYTDSKSKTTSLSNFLSIQNEKIKGIISNFNVVSTWQKDHIYYVALGKTFKIP